MALYEYGTDPTQLIAKSGGDSVNDRIRKNSGMLAARSVRWGGVSAKSSNGNAGAPSARNYPDIVQARLRVAPAEAPRAPGVTLRVSEKTWLQRLEQYRTAASR